MNMFIVYEGLPFIIFPIICGILLVIFSKSNIFLISLGIIFIGIGLFCLYFFRDPIRKIPNNENIFVSPGDGTILEVCEEDKKNVIRIFLSVFNVHLQRAPVSGFVKSVEYKPGKFYPAMKHDAHIVNEQNIITIDSVHGEYIIKQIAGILARRVVAWVKPGQKIKQGEKIGLIKFGSQVDLILPSNVTLLVKPGDKVVGGETPVAVIK